MTLGKKYNASGSYTMTDQGTGHALNLNVSGAEIVGQNGAGTFVQNGGQNQAGSLLVNNDGGQGPDSYTLNKGTLTTGQTNIGNAMIDPSNTSSYNQTGGIASTGAFSMATACNGASGGASASSLDLRNSFAATGVASQGEVNLSGGSLHVNYSAVIGAGDSTSGNPAIAGNDYGINGLVNQSGGELSVGSNLTVGEAGSIVGGQGVFNQSGGSLKAANMTVGTDGTFNYSGGSFTLSSGTGILTNAGQVTINGGGNQTLSANIINEGSFKVTDMGVE